MVQRKHIGPAHSPYPAKKLKENTGFITFKLVAGIVCVMIWLGLFYTGLFMIATIMGGAGDDGPTANQLFENPIAKIVFGVGAVAAFIGVLRSRIGSKPNRKDRNESRLL